MLSKDTNTIADELPAETDLVKGVTPKRYLMLVLFCLAVYLNEISQFGDVNAMG